MQILVRSLEETFAVSVNPNGDLNELKAAIEDMGQKHRADYDAAYQALVLKGLSERSRGLA